MPAGNGRFWTIAYRTEFPMPILQHPVVYGGWPPTAKRVSHLFSLTGGVKWVPHVSRGSRRGNHRGRLQGIASRSQLSSVSDTVPAGSLRSNESPIRRLTNPDCESPKTGTAIADAAHVSKTARRGAPTVIFAQQQNAASWGERGHPPPTRHCRRSTRQCRTIRHDAG